MSASDTQTILNTISILVVDDRQLVHETIQMHLEGESDLEIIGHATSGREAISQIEQQAPDVVILDLEMPDMNGLAVIGKIRDRFKQTKILVFSSHDDREYISRAIEAGAKGYINKGTSLQELANAVRAVDKGHFQLGPGLLEKLVISLNRETTATSKSLEAKLVTALKKFKLDTNQQIDKLVTAHDREFEQKYELNLDSYMRNFNKKYNRLDLYIKQVEFRFYWFILISIIVWFAFIAYWIISS